LNFWLFTPEISLAVFAIVVILLDLVVPRKGLLTLVSIAGIAVAAGFSVVMWGMSPQAIFSNMLAVDSFALFFKLLFLGIAALVILASTDYVSRFARFQGEYHALVLLSCLGMMLMAATMELISIYVALELTSISLYILVGFLKDARSSEASLKYLLLGPSPRRRCSTEWRWSLALPVRPASVRLRWLSRRWRRMVFWLTPPLFWVLC